MSSRVIWEGLDAFRDSLRDMARNFGNDGSSIVEETVARAANELRQGYPERTGELRSKVRTQIDRGVNGVIGIVRNTSPLAFIFEHGTQARHTKLGANRGSMPPGHVFIPIAARNRRRMYEQLKAMIEAAGFRVSGDV